MSAEKTSLTFTWAGLIGYLFFAPVSIAASQSFFGISVLAFLVYLIFCRNRKNLVFPPKILMAAIVLYVGYKFVAMISAGSDLLMIKEDWLFLMVIVGAVTFRDIKKLTLALDIFALSIVLMSGYGIWQHFVGVDLYDRVLLDRMAFGYRVIGNFSTYLTFSGFFAISSIFLVPTAFSMPNRWRKAFYLLASQASLACIMFNYSRSTIVALIIGIIVLILLIGAQYRRWVSLLLLLTLAVGLVISPDFLNRFKNMSDTEFSTEYANSRFAIWSATAKMVEDNPVFGIGPGNFYQNYIKYRTNRTGKNLSHAHNDIFNIAAESGIPCALLYILLWIIMLTMLYKGYIRCPDGIQRSFLLGGIVVSIVFMVMSQFEAFFADEEVRLLLMFFWGIGLAVLGNMKASEKLSEIA